MHDASSPFCFPTHSETGESRTGEDPNESERRDEEERQEADERDAEGEVADRRQEGEGHDDDHGLATEEELAVKYAEKQRDMVRCYFLFVARRSRR